jgi:tRNA pseudouridine55 synthase
MSRRGATSLVGVLPIDKPAGLTSHDVVARVRRLTGEGRVGHAGTLDPMATGLLVVLIGAYTRLAPYLTAATKSYEATIAFGSETDTDDAEGEVVRSAPVPPDVLDTDRARAALASFLGRSMQAPPAYSAIKVGGKVAHRAARAGDPLALEPREIDVNAADLIAIDPDAATWRVAFTVSKGTYVRALARDLGRACGTAAHLSALRRTTSGALSLDDAHTLEEVETSAAAGTLADLLADPLAALALPIVATRDEAVRTGARIPAPADPRLAEGSNVAVTLGDALAGVYRLAGGRLEPAVVFPGGGAS